MTLVEITERVKAVKKNQKMRRRESKMDRKFKGNKKMRWYLLSYPRHFL